MATYQRVANSSGDCGGRKGGQQGREGQRGVKVGAAVRGGVEKGGKRLSLDPPGGGERQL